MQSVFMVLFLYNTFEFLRRVRATKVVFSTVNVASLKWQTFVKKEEKEEKGGKKCAHFYLITFIGGIWKSFVLIKYSLINVHLFLHAQQIFQSVNNCFRKFEYTCETVLIPVKWFTVHYSFTHTSNTYVTQ